MNRERHLNYRIGSRGDVRGVDAAVATLATRQEGIVSHPQLVALGLSDREIYIRLAAKRLHRMHRGVYAVGHRRISRTGCYLAAVLSGGDGAALSHRSAA